MRSKKIFPKLDKTIIYKLNETFESSPIFLKEEKYSDKFFLCRAVIERLELAVDYINNNIKYPFNNHEFICFMMYATMIIDGVKVLYERIFQKSPYNKEIKYFKHAQEQNILHLSKDEFINDDKFFEYLRSITFAHPFNTDRTYKNIYGSQVSPSVLPGVLLDKVFKDDIEDPVGALVFTSKKDKYGTNTIIVESSFAQLYAYINDRYEKITQIIEWFKDESFNKIEEWKSHKTSKNLMPTESLLEIINILKERYKNFSGVYQLLFYLNCKISNENNRNKIDLYRSEIIKQISLMQKALDDFDYDELDSIILSLTKVPRRLKGECHYQLEKIYRDLPENDMREAPADDRESWALKQADEFYKMFAKKWVQIDVNTMSNSEIKLLVAVSLYCENNKNLI